MDNQENTPIALTKINDENISQLRLVPSKEVYKLPGPVLVLAGPGTGKTVSMAQRAKWLIEEKKMDPKRIVIITFTKEASQNFKATIDQTSSNKGPSTHIESKKWPAHIRTMHGLAYLIIRSDKAIRKALGIRKDCELLNDDQIRLLIYQDATKRLGYSADKAQETMDFKRTADVTIEQPPYCYIEEEYLILLKRCNRVDHDSSIKLACKALGDPTMRATIMTNLFAGGIQNLIVDEYQDINNDQLNLIKLLGADCLNGLYAVGDDEQSIYAFKGGMPSFVSNFPVDIGGTAEIVTVNQCWRFPEKIALAARILLNQFFQSRIKKHNPRFETSEPAHIYKHHFYTDTEEAGAVARICASKFEQGDRIFVLVPNKSYIYPLISALQKEEIAFVFKEGSRCDSVLNLKYLGQLTNKSDNANVRACMELAIRSLWVKEAAEGEELSPDALQEQLHLEVARLWDRVDSNRSLYQAVLEGVASSKFIGLIADCLSEVIDPKPGKLKATENLGNIFNKFRIWPTSKSLYKDISIISKHVGSKYPVASDKVVRITTIHGSKGLTGDIIFIVGLSEGIFPSDLHKQNLPETARLMYVAMTRTKKELYMFGARRVYSKAGYQTPDKELAESSFVDAIPDQYFDELKI